MRTEYFYTRLKGVTLVVRYGPTMLYVSRY